MTAAAAPALPASALRRGATRTPGRMALDLGFAAVLFAATLVGVLALVVLLAEIYELGWDRLAADPIGFLTSFPSRRAARAGIRAALVGSAMLMAITAAAALPIGIGAAVYLESFARRGRLTTIVEANIANLAGVPSVVYGILGLGVFVRTMRLGNTLLAGGLTLAVMSLPVVIIAAREAIRAVPPSIRQGALALGATELQAVRRQVLPAAFPGILTGAILALSRAVGETAPILVVGAAVSIYSTPSSLLDQFSALPILIFNWTSRPQAAFAEAAGAASIVLLALLLAMNAVAIFLRNRFSTRW